MIGDIYHGADRARMQGYVSGVFIGSAVLGPVVGAFLVAHTIWQMVFWFNVPLGLIAGAILMLVFKERFERRPGRIDVAARCCSPPAASCCSMRWRNRRCCRWCGSRR